MRSAGRLRSGSGLADESVRFDGGLSAAREGRMGWSAVKSPRIAATTLTKPVDNFWWPENILGWGNLAVGCVESAAGRLSWRAC
jgi:hypothetical protein